MICFEPTASGGAKELHVPAEKESLALVNDFVDSFLEEHDCPMKAQMQIDLCVEEAFVNIASYAYGGDKGDATIRLEETDGTVALTLIDSGTPYDPLARDDPDISLSAEDRQIGGLGIFLIKKSMDTVEYRYENGRNILRMTKKLN